MSVSIVHAADLHLESSFAGLPPAQAALRREDLKHTFLQIIEFAAKEKAQILLFAGDLFEHDRAGRELMHFLNSGFSRLNARVFVSPGNHDPGLPGSPYWSFPWAENVHIFREEIEAVPLEELGCVVYGLGFAHFAVKDPLLRGFQVKDPEQINLMVLHGDDRTNPLAAASSSNYLPFTASDLALAGADYYALGHHHRPRVIWEEQGLVKACYAGSTEPLGFGEEGEHGVFFGTVGKEQSQLRFVRLNQRSYRTLTLRCSGEGYLEQLVELALQQIPAVERQRDLFRLIYAGEVEPALEFDRIKLEELLSPHFFHCRVENDTVSNYDLNSLDTRTVRGMFTAKLQALLQEAEAEEDKELFRKTLYYGLDALNLGKVGER